MKKFSSRLIGLTLAFAIMFFGLSSPVSDFFHIPNLKRITTNDYSQLDYRAYIPESLAQKVQVQVNNIDTNSMNNNDHDWFELQLKLFGIVPLKNVAIQFVQPVNVYPGGQAIGVLISTEGVQVTGHAAVIDQRGNKLYLARDIGLVLGDSILEINGEKVDSDHQVAEIIDTAGKENRAVRLTVKRDEKIYYFDVMPQYCNETGRYRIGVFVRDSTAGVGTLTFYDEDKVTFGALGHIVADGDGKQEIYSEGKIVPATIYGIQQGRRGQPGEKIGLFKEKSDFNGIIKKNTKVGIFGEIQGEIENSFQGMVTVALAEEVSPGPAEILTVIEGERVDSFTIEIVRVMPNYRNSGKGMVIKVTDPRLLSLTGGIIQGMSGSPILQEGKLVGAVTHVFINDPTKGYGVFAEWMLQETNLINPMQSRGMSIMSPGLILCLIMINNENFCAFLRMEGLSILYVETSK